MATEQQLDALGIIVLIEVELDPDEQPQRLIYALPSVIEWMENELPGLETDGYIEGALRPKEQAAVLFYDVISGKDPLTMAPRCMMPNKHGVWELRTHDLRIFGFFSRKGVFIATSADTKARCKVTGTYGKHRRDAVQARETLDLDPPKFVPGSTLADVL